MNIIPNTFVDAFAKGEILQVLLIAILFGFALSLLGERGRPITRFIEDLSHVIFGVVEHHHEGGPDRRLRRDGLHHRQIRHQVADPAGLAGRLVLPDLRACSS